MPLMQQRNSETLNTTTDGENLPRFLNHQFWFLPRLQMLQRDDSHVTILLPLRKQHMKSRSSVLSQCYREGVETTPTITGVDPCAAVSTYGSQAQRNLHRQPTIHSLVTVVTHLPVRVLPRDGALCHHSQDLPSAWLKAWPVSGFPPPLTGLRVWDIPFLCEGLATVCHQEADHYRHRVLPRL